MKHIVVCSAVLGKAEAVQKNICIRKISKQKYIKKRKRKVLRFTKQNKVSPSKSHKSLSIK